MILGNCDGESASDMLGDIRRLSIGLQCFELVAADLHKVLVITGLEKDVGLRLAWLSPQFLQMVLRLLSRLAEPEAPKAKRRRASAAELDPGSRISACAGRVLPPRPATGPRSAAGSG